MSADQLLRAAAVLRDHGGRAQNTEPWCAEDLYWGIRHLQRNVDLDHDCPNHPGEGCPGPDMYDGRYVALMHPPVALALAAVLDEAIPHTPNDTDDWPIVALARAILREEEPS